MRRSAEVFLFLTGSSDCVCSVQGWLLAIRSNAVWGSVLGGEDRGWNVRSWSRGKPLYSVLSFWETRLSLWSRSRWWNVFGGGCYCCLLALFVIALCAIAPRGGSILWFQSCSSGCMFHGKIVEILANGSPVMFCQVCICLRKLFLKLAANGEGSQLCRACWVGRLLGQVKSSPRTPQRTQSNPSFIAWQGRGRKTVEQGAVITCLCPYSFSPLSIFWSSAV